MDPLESEELIQLLEAQVKEFSSSQRRRFLVVEDEEMCSLLMCTVLSNFGDCDVAINGGQALQSYRAALEEGRPYDLICLDLKLPDMDGSDILKHLRQYEAVTGQRSAVKVIVVSGVRAAERVLDMYRMGCQ